MHEDRHIRRQLHGPAEGIVKAAADAIRTHRVGDLVATGTFEGDVRAGVFTVPTLVGDVGGSYRIDGSTVHITISHKPLLVPYASIIEAIDRFLGVVVPTTRESTQPKP